VLAKIMSLVETDKMELAEALNKATEDALKEEQKRQEEEAMNQGGAMTPDQMMAPAMTAAMGGPNAASPQSPIPGAGQGMEDLGSMLGALRRPGMTVQPMRGVERGAM
jgi:hypothetical protein